MTTAPATAPVAMKRKTRRKSRAMPIVISAALVGGLGWFGWTKTHPAEDANSKLLTAPVTRGDIVEAISATGSITAQTGAQVKIGSQITGTIQRLYADVGSFVKAGQPIAVLNLPDLEAQVNQAKASYAQALVNQQQAQTRLAQQKTTLGMTQAQNNSAVIEAQAALRAAQARQSAATSAATQQGEQTPQDVKRAQNALSVSRAALSTAQSNLKQVQASINLQIATAQEGLTQAQATYKNSAANLTRQQQLLGKGFVAQSIVDQAQAQASVDQSKIESAQQNIDLVKAKVAADLQTAQNQVAQEQQNVESAQSSLTLAQTGKYTVSARQADLQNAIAQVNQARATLVTARANLTQIDIKQQDIQQAVQAVQVAADAVRVAKSQVDYQNAQFAKTIIRSPISGTVLQLASQQGETLAAGLSAPTLIVVADLNRLQVDTYVDETDIAKVHLGQEADITVDAFAKRPFKGKVTKIASGSTIQNGVITYDVTLSIEKESRGGGKQGRGGMGMDKSGGAGGMGAGTGKGMRPEGMAGGPPPTGGTGNRPGTPGASGGQTADGGSGRSQGGADDGGASSGGRRVDVTKLLKPDMTASVAIQVGKHENVLLVPSEAVKQGSRGATVNVLTKKDGKDDIAARPVKTGSSDGVNTEIRDGVKEGDIIVRAGMQDPNRRQMGPGSPFGPSKGGGKGGGKGG